MCCTLSIPLHLSCGQWPPYIHIGHCNNGQSKHSSLLGSHQLGYPTIVGSCWLATVGLLGVHKMRKDRLEFWKLTVLLMANGVAMHCMLCASSRLRCFLLVPILQHTYACPGNIYISHQWSTIDGNVPGKWNVARRGHTGLQNFVSMDVFCCAWGSKSTKEWINDECHIKTANFIALWKSRARWNDYEAGTKYILRSPLKACLC